MKRGRVYLVGAGPGSPGLITVRGLDCLQRADVIVYDQLIDQALLDSARPEAERVYVGKTPKRHTLEQEEINRLLVEKATEGKVVVRLKGGDPFVLGRGGEEAEALAGSRIPFEVVPGVSAATAVPAYAGIPVTQRGLASSFAVVTGHEDEGKARSSIAWEKLATGTDTLVFLMGVGNLSRIVSKLLEHGRTPSTPVALIRDGTWPSQQTVVGTLADIADRVAESSLGPPAVMVVGEVVGLREGMRWFDSLPLFGKRILVTRARHQAAALSGLLAERGALPVEMPAIDIRAGGSKELDAALLHLADYNWAVFTSVNGVEAFFARLRVLGLDARALHGVRLGAIGPATAEALQRHGLCPDYLPQTYTSEGLLAGLRGQQVTGGRFLLPRADLASEELAQGIAALGAEVEEVAAYSTVLPAEEASAAKRMLLAREVDVITFTSASTVTNLMALLGDERGRIERAKIACIGPRTAAAAEEAGLVVDMVAREHTIPGLVEAVEQHFAAGGKEA